MMVLVSRMVRAPKTRMGKRLIGHWAANSAPTSGCSGESMRTSKGVAFS